MVREINSSSVGCWDNTGESELEVMVSCNKPIHSDWMAELYSHMTAREVKK